MRYLLINLMFLLVVSCASYPEKNNYKIVNISEEVIKNPYFSDIEKDYVYKANIEVYGRSLGGLFIVKKMADTKHRIVFTTEMGNTIFDFTFYNNEFKVNYVIDDLNRKFLLNILEKDFRALVREKSVVKEMSINEGDVLFKTELVNDIYYYNFKENNILSNIFRVNNGKDKVHFKFSDIDTVSAKNIQILHNNIKLKINLKSIN